MAEVASPHDTQALAELRGLLDESPYPAIRGTTCERHDGVLVLRGRVSSYYMRLPRDTHILASGNMTCNTPDRH